MSQPVKEPERPPAQARDCLGVRASCRRDPRVQGIERLAKALPAHLLPGRDDVQEAVVILRHDRPPPGTASTDAADSPPPAAQSVSAGSTAPPSTTAPSSCCT